MIVFFINDTSDNANWGCRATTQALTSMIVENGADIKSRLYLSRMHEIEEYIPNQICKKLESSFQSAKKLLPIGKRSINRLGKKLISPWWDKLSGRRDIVPECFADFEGFAQDLMSNRILTSERASIESCDLVVINGEGSIYDRQRKGRMMLFLAYVAVKHFRKKCILVNHTADIHDPIMEEIVANVYPLLDDVVFREPLSYEACSKFLENSSTTLASDAAFTYQPLSQTHLIAVASRDGYFSVWPDSAKGFDPSKPYICVGGSSIYLRPDRPQYDPVPGFLRLCQLLNEQIAPVILIAPCYTDQNIFRPVAKTLKLPLIGLHTPTQQAADILGNASACISGRWHPSILALTGGTPIVTLTANTYKTQALLQQIGLEATTFDALNLHQEIDKIVELTASYIDQGNDLRNRLKAEASILANRSYRNIHYLAKQNSRAELVLQ